MVFQWGCTVSVTQLITMLQTAVTVKLETKTRTWSLSPINLQASMHSNTVWVCVTGLQLGPKAEIHDSYWTCSRKQHNFSSHTGERVKTSPQFHFQSGANQILHYTRKFQRFLRGLKAVLQAGKLPSFPEIL